MRCQEMAAKEKMVRKIMKSIPENPGVNPQFNTTYESCRWVMVSIFIGDTNTPTFERN